MRPVFYTRAAFADEAVPCPEGVAAWPAFTLRAHVRPGLADRIASHEAVFFSSPSAMKACRREVASWPRGTRLWVLGRTSRQKALELWPGVDVQAPGLDTGESGSEAFAAWLESARSPSSVLILHGQGARLNLKPLLEQKGIACAAEELYARTPLVLCERRQTLLRGWLREQPPVSFYASPDAVGAFCAAFEAVPGALDWLKRGAACAIHPNVVRRLSQAGFATLALTPGDEAFYAYLRRQEGARDLG